MITKIRDFEILPQSKEALTELEDGFGGRMIVQTPLLTGDHEADVNAAVALMESNEAAFTAKLKIHEFTEVEIAALQVAPK
jgi:hypothetical protein